MSVCKPSLLFFLVLIIGFTCQKEIAAQARPLSILRQQRYNKLMATLGVGCKCCDGAAGECRSLSDGPCSKLQCFPWKLY